MYTVEIIVKCGPVCTGHILDYEIEDNYKWDEMRDIAKAMFLSGTHIQALRLEDWNYNVLFEGRRSR